MSGKAAERMHISLASPFILEMWIIIFLVEFVKGSLLVALLPVYMENILGSLRNSGRIRLRAAVSRG